MIKRALLSVSDKTGIVELGLALKARGIEVLSTGGTAKALADAGVDVTEVASHTGFPEIMGGRVKTLHPKIHGGILGRRGTDDEVMEQQGIEPIDLVVVNLYPFQQTVAKPDCSFEDAIENIDIGGPAMVRAAAKNHQDVLIVVDPSDYSSVVDALNDPSERLRRRLAAKAFAHTAAYDGAIANWLTGPARNAQFPETLSMQFQRNASLRYGENPHQQAAFYTEGQGRSGTIAAARMLNGKALSYNNIADADAALECVKAFPEAPTCVIVKHANPCGVASASDLMTAYDRAFAVDPTSAFGGIIAFNQSLDAATAKAILERQFVEVVIAPRISAEAVEAFKAKPNVRLLQTGPWEHDTTEQWDFKRVGDGLLVQEADLGSLDQVELRVVSKRQPTDDEMADMKFAWRVAKYVKSNAIVYARDAQTIGIGAGQMSRVISARIAGIKANDAELVVPGSAMASDAFFPFRDGIDSAAEAGIRSVIQPGGSMRDEEVIAAADEHDIAMVFTGMRHFRH